MEVKKTNVNSKNIWSEIEFLPPDIEADESTLNKIKTQVAEYLLEQTLLNVGEAKSPVSGESFPGLSKEYKKFKISESRPGVANLEFTGDMLDDLSYELTETGVRIGFFGTKEAEKADGHNNFSGQSELPKRRFLPEKGQNYKLEIEKQISRIITDNLGSQITISDSTLEDVGTKAEFWEVMTDIFPSFTRAQIVGAVSRSFGLTNKLAKFDLLKYLE